MPNFAAASTWVDTATKWRCSSASGTPPASDQSRAVCAFIIVSAVVNVFDATMKSVVPGSSDASASTIACASTLATNCTVRPAW